MNHYTCFQNSKLVFTLSVLLFFQVPVVDHDKLYILKYTPVCAYLIFLPVYLTAEKESLFLQSLLDLDNTVFGVIKYTDSFLVHSTQFCKRAMFCMSAEVQSRLKLQRGCGNSNYTTYMRSLRCQIKTIMEGLRTPVGQPKMKYWKLHELQKSEVKNVHSV